MAEPFLGEIRLVSFNVPPKGWAYCNGQFLPINQNQALFSLLGTTFGGNGQTTFALPDLRGRTPIHVGQGHTLGERAGEQAHTVSIAEMPSHTHVLSGTSNNGTEFTPGGNLLAKEPNFFYHSPDNGLATMNAGTVATMGGSQAHLNMQPFLTLTFMIAMVGIFPSPN